jgi:hypothetical protein
VTLALTKSRDLCCLLPAREGLWEAEAQKSLLKTAILPVPSTPRGALDRKQCQMSMTPHFVVMAELPLGMSDSMVLRERSLGRVQRMSLQKPRPPFVP